MRDLFEEANLGRVDVDALRALEDLDDGDVTRDLEHLARLRRDPSGMRMATISLYATPCTLFTNTSGPVTYEMVR